MGAKTQAPLLPPTAGVRILTLPHKGKGSSAGTPDLSGCATSRTGRCRINPAFRWLGRDALAAGPAATLRVVLVFAFCFASGARADDWPQWLGPKRDGVWRETGILDKFPSNGLAVLWRTNVQRGYCGPAVAGGRLFMLDREPGPPLTRKPGDRSIPTAAGNERVLCLDASNGRKIWEHTYDCPYRIGYPAGPRA